MADEVAVEVFFTPKLFEKPPELGKPLEFFVPELVSTEKIQSELTYEDHFNFIKANLLYNRSQLDWVHVIVGAEGTGKSNCAIRDACFIDEKFLEQGPDLPQVIYTKKDLDNFWELVKTSPKYQGRRGIAVVLDEAHTMFYALDALKRENRKNKKDMMKARDEYSIFYVMNMQYIKDFDTYIRTQRARSLGRCYWRTQNAKTPLGDIAMIKQGYVDYYSHKKLVQIKMNLQTKRPEFPIRSFGSSFPKANEEFWQAMKEKKQAWRNKEGPYEYLKKEGKNTNEEYKLRLLEQYVLGQLANRTPDRPLASG